MVVRARKRPMMTWDECRRRERDAHINKECTRRAQAEAGQCFERAVRCPTVRVERRRVKRARRAPPATMIGLRRPSTPAEAPRTSLRDDTGTRTNDLLPTSTDARRIGAKPRPRATATSGAKGDAAPSRERRAGAPRAEQRWKLHSKECASRRNLKAPYAFKSLMIH